jgi:hypothetical protein
MKLMDQEDFVVCKAMLTFHLLLFLHGFLNLISSQKYLILDLQKGQIKSVSS